MMTKRNRGKDHQADDAGTEISTWFDRVTLLEDRARVVRRGRVDVGTRSQTTILISDISPVLVDKTVTVRILGESSEATAFEISDVRVLRRLIREPERDEQAMSDRDALILELRAQLVAVRDKTVAAQLVEAEADGLHRMASWTLGELSDDVARGRGLDAAIGERLTEVGKNERELRAKAARMWIEIKDEDVKTARLRDRISTCTGPDARKWCGVEFDVALGSPAEKPAKSEFEFELEYVVGAAMWRPVHAAVLSGDGVVTLTTRASVWQRTGEDWTDADLLFSTERASLGAEPPMLATDELAVKKRDETLVVEIREQEVNTLSARTSTVASAAELPGIDDGGAVVSLRSSEPLTVPSDGRSHQIPLGEFSIEANPELWCHPELSAAVIHKTVLTNGGSVPVLAGPVELIRAGGWVGRTSVGFVAPGEEFELSWGAEPTLRVHRVVEDSKAESRVLSSWISKAHHIELRASNFGSSSARVFVRERIPVSEIEKVKVEFDAKTSTDRAEPDSDGFITWEIELDGHGRRRLEFGYAVKRHSDVVGGS